MKFTCLFSDLIFLVTVGSIVGNEAQAWLWDGFNYPGNIEQNFVYQYDKLPKKGRLPDPLPWSETYWPAQKGSINVRWNSPSRQGFKHKLLSKSQAASASRAELAQLSPTEKYDIAMGRFDYPLYHEAERLADPHAKDWMGICDGWSLAAISYVEPDAVDVRSPDGIIVPFGSSDIKGLMSFAATSFYFDLGGTGQIGSRCWNRGGIFRNWDCEDVNAGAMHVVITNMIGLRQKAVIFDRDRGPEIWNQPVFGFEFTEVGTAAPEAGAAKAVQIRGVIHYTDELDKSNWEPVSGTAKFKSSSIKMDYIVEMDAAGNVVGGQWLRGSDYPDFVWIPRNRLTFNGYFAGINAIYQPIKR